MAQFAHYFIKYKHDGPQSLVVLRCGLGDVLDFQTHLFFAEICPQNICDFVWKIDGNAVILHPICLHDFHGCMEA